MQGKAMAEVVRNKARMSTTIRQSQRLSRGFLGVNSFSNSQSLFRLRPRLLKLSEVRQNDGDASHRICLILLIPSAIVCSPGEPEDSESRLEMTGSGPGGSFCREHVIRARGRNPPQMFTPHT